MKHLALICAVLSTATLTSRPATSTEPLPLNCGIGPIAKVYGKTQWLVYSCDDDRTVVILAAPGNPAMPFYFMFSPQESGYRLTGEGTGRGDATRAAFDELEALSERQILALIEQTKTH